MINTWNILDHSRFQEWWSKKHPSIALEYPVAAARLAPHFTVRDAGAAAGFAFKDDGRSAIILPVGDDRAPVVHEILNFVAWFPEQPERIATLHDTRGLWLGAHDLHEALTYGREVALHDTPLEWLQAGCRGACPLDDVGLEVLRPTLAGRPPVVACSAGMSERIRKVLCRMPLIKG